MSGDVAAAAGVASWRESAEAAAASSGVAYVMASTSGEGEGAAAAWARDAQPSGRAGVAVVVAATWTALGAAAISLEKLGTVGTGAAEAKCAGVRGAGARGAAAKAEATVDAALHTAGARCAEAAGARCA